MIVTSRYLALNSKFALFDTCFMSSSWATLILVTEAFVDKRPEKKGGLYLTDLFMPALRCQVITIGLQSRT